MTTDMQHNRVTADGDTLMRQAPATADLYFQSAVAAVKQEFGPDGAKNYPQLVVAHMNASAMDFGASVLARAIEAIADRPTEL